MFQKHTNVSSTDIKSDSVRLFPTPEANSTLSNTNNNNNNNLTTINHERIASTSNSKQPHLHQHHHHHHHHPHLQNQNQNLSNNNPKEEPKSQRLRNFHSLSQHSQHPAFYNNSNSTSNNNSNSNNNGNNNNQDMQSSNNNNNLNQRNGGQQQQLNTSTIHPQIYQASPSQQHVIKSSSSHPKSASLAATTSSSASSSRSALNSENQSVFIPPNSSYNNRQVTKQTASSISAMLGQMSQQSRDGFRSVLNSRQDQQDRETNEVVTMIKEELENDQDCFKETDLETLDSLEKNLPVELSFLIRQQAYCMARMNYLDRQIRELKEARQAIPSQTSPTPTIRNQQSNRNIVTATTTNTTNAPPNNNTTSVHNKNGNFIPSDDSGGEYSRATISDDDELSSLLDQIAKSVRPERHQNSSRMNSQQQQLPQQQQQRPLSYSVISNQPQQYTIINPNQLHHQAVPVFVMGSPIAVAHPSSISSTVLPGVHFQPEPRYNQYYEDFYVQNNSSSSTLHRHNGMRSQQFDSSITAIEQLVSQKEKRQIKSQLKSADNWLKMRSSGLCNLNGNFGNTNIGTNNVGHVEVSGSSAERNIPASTSSATLVTDSNSVIEENRSR